MEHKEYPVKVHIEEFEFSGVGHLHGSGSMKLDRESLSWLSVLVVLGSDIVSSPGRTLYQFE